MRSFKIYDRPIFLPEIERVNFNTRSKEYHMSTISTGKALALAIVAAAFGSGITTLYFKSNPPVAVAAAEKKAPDRPAQAVDIEAVMKDRSIGRDDAPMTIIEYASMTCDHCAAFHNSVFAEVKTALIDTGKARLVYRDMPWDKFAIKAAKIARCAPPEKYFDMVKAIFESQPKWAHGSDPLQGLVDLATAAGMDENDVRSCANNEELDKRIIELVQIAQKEYEVKSTPTFIFLQDGERVGSYPEFEAIKAKMPAHDHSHD